MINLIARMSNIRLNAGFAEKSKHPDQELLDSVEHDLLTLNQDTKQLVAIHSASEAEHGIKISQLYQIAALIYFERVLKPYSNQSRLARWSAEAFDIVRQLKICERSFPLFFVACEAKTDEERQTIISLVARTHRKSSQRNLHAIEQMIQSMWVQHDLASDTGEGNYVNALNNAMSSSQMMPTLA
jgi:hypothetical protein